ncbi:RrF2 family transcriptional regulator [Aquisalimonas asiatica]|uniref:Transcriptional regulator, BadM/Rrf2 family n=1 Tax=Aquisalimonas asiatica TaxID=406100 RepID=A0A1H8UPA5_9GAMM|nr:Rrf2 family transcriptional regulator [Aquisalimonas asiatica]SEP04981.1 transcriptional regulator, BadM/Rrf2 family [Aquisalimonas asiatica]
MRLTRHTDHAFRALIYMGLLDRGELVTIGRIAEDYAISRNHLMKVMQKLVQNGFVASTRGKHGGVCLGVSPGDIRLGDVARVTEGQDQVNACLDSNGDRECPLQPDCPLHHAMGEAMDAFYAVLDRYTLADMLADPERLGALLGFESTTASGAGASGR